MLAVRHIVDGRVETVERDRIAELRGGPGFLWVDVAEPTPDEERILHGDQLGLDEAIIEDMIEDVHLPKVETLGEWLSLTVHGILVETATIEVDTVELDIAMTHDLLVTFHREEVASVTVVGNRLDRRGGRGLDRPVNLLHLVLDTMNDVFVPFVDLMERRLDVIEEDILTEPTEDTRREIYGLQRDIIQLRRAVVPQAEVIRRLGRDRIGLLTDDDRGLFRDIYDHLYRMAEMSESYRQLLDSAMDNYRSSLDDDLNDMLRVLTLISALLLPISVIAGIYGTNFEYVPELQWRYSYFVMWFSFIVIVGGMGLWFRKRGWIGGQAEKAARERRKPLQQAMEVPVLGKVLKVPGYGVSAVAKTGRAVAGAGRAVAKAPGAVARRGRNGEGDE